MLHVTTGRPGYSPKPPPPVLKSLEPRLWDKLATLNIARKRRSGRRVSRIIRLPCSRGGGSDGGGNVGNGGGGGGCLDIGGIGGGGCGCGGGGGGGGGSGGGCWILVVA